MKENNRKGATNAKKKKFVRLKIEDFKIEKIRSIVNYELCPDWIGIGEEILNYE